MQLEGSGSDRRHGTTSGDDDGQGPVDRLQHPLRDAQRVGLHVPGRAAGNGQGRRSSRSLPNVTINYGGGGSGKGKTDLQGNVVDFAGTDSLVKPEDLPKYAGGVLYFPIAAAPITVAYQLDGVTKLQLSADTIAKIFQAQITKWNDAAIEADNPGVTLPDTPIVVVHRQEGSGHDVELHRLPDQGRAHDLDARQGRHRQLAGVDAERHRQPRRRPSDRQRLRLRSRATNGAIGYVDFADAKATNLKLASIKNAAGKFVAPSLAGVSAALDETTPNADLTFDPLNAAGETAYPIATPTWILVYKNQTDKAKGEALKGFLNFMLTDGQSLNEAANYAKLPASYRTKAIAQLDDLVIPGVTAIAGLAAAAHAWPAGRSRRSVC